ncbi:MAG TPA: pentapeptide repeat-containing protein [Pyrinomonadaceae bacterium]|nr:pentapeptide repeat-containing protein [Pyrinomonadaceae bacterium]
MANSDQIKILYEGVEAWNQWRESNPYANVDFQNANFYEHDFRKANLSKAFLLQATLTGAYLMEADLTKASMHKVDFEDADLSQAILVKAQLSSANLRQAKLRGADLRSADLRNANLTDADLAGANLSGAVLCGATLVETNLEEANLSGCFVYGISAWNVKLNRASQADLVITPYGESPIQVDDLEVAQFIYLLLHNEKLRNVIDTVGKKAVLILGRFTAERKIVLDSIRESLRRKGYLPILFDFEKPGSRDIHETVVTLASMSRFIVADITDPKSIPQELAAIVPNFPSVPVQPVLQTGYEPWGMYDHISRYPWVLPLVRYVDQEALIAGLEADVIDPAEKRAREQKPR